MTSEADRILAAEFVAGLLDPQAQADAEQRAARDAAFAQEVAAWRARLADFDDTAPEIEAGPALLERIEQSARQITSAPEPRPSGWQALWGNLSAWRMATAIATVFAGVFALSTLMAVQFARDEAARKPLYVAILVDDATKNAGAVVNAFADGRVELIPLTDINVPEGRALEIWTLWDRAVGPRSVGLIGRAQTIMLNLNGMPKTGPDQLFEITLEPASGSPIGRPTGPILFKGTTSRAL